jgi:hypothetical protein
MLFERYPVSFSIFGVRLSIMNINNGWWNDGSVYIIDGIYDSHRSELPLYLGHKVKVNIKPFFWIVLVWIMWIPLFNLLLFRLRRRLKKVPLSVNERWWQLMITGSLRLLPIKLRRLSSF